MTEEEIITAANIVLLNFDAGDPKEINMSDLKYWLNDNNNNKQFDNIISDSTDGSFNKVHGYLIKQGYLAINFSNVHQKYLSKKGIKAKELGGIKQYLAWDKKKKCIDRLKEWAFWMTLFAAIISAAYAIADFYSTDKTKSEPTMKLDLKTTQSKVTQIHQQENASITDSLNHPDSLPKTIIGNTKTLIVVDFPKHK